MNMDPAKSFYFTRQTTTDAKEILEFREKFETPEARARVLDIWKEFSEENSQGPPKGLQVNLFLKVVSITEKFKALGYRITF